MFFRKRDDSLLMIQPVFCPDAELLQVNLRSLTSVLAYLKRYPYDRLLFVLGGYCGSPDFWSEIRDALAQAPANLHTDVTDYGKNLGKAYVVNDLFARFAGSHTFLMTMDSDIVFDEQEPDMLRRLVRVFRSYRAWRRLGMISLFQKEACCHRMPNMTRRKLVAGEELVYPRRGGGIAGGCVFTTCANFGRVGGYRIMGVYSGDDGFLVKDMHARRWRVVISKSIPVIHPATRLSYAGNYQAWKDAALRDCRDVNGTRITTDELRRRAGGVELLWSSRFAGANPRT